MNKKKQPFSSESADKKSVDLKHFQEEVIDPYKSGTASGAVPANELAARSLIPPMTALQRSFDSVSSEFPVYKAESCVACMECVISCPDAAIAARVTPEEEFNKALVQAKPEGDLAQHIKSRFVKTTKFWNTYEKRGQVPALFSIWVDPDKCKGCGECVTVCSAGNHNALAISQKPDLAMGLYKDSIKFLNAHLPHTPEKYIDPRLLTDLFLHEDKWIFEGGAGACRGCGEITALKMAMMATTAKHGKDLAIVAATGCNSVFSSTYPWNIFNVPWTNSLFENAPATALGVRMRLNQTGNRKTKVWVVGGDGAMNDIGFQSLSRALMSGEDINILVLDTQAYSNTGGQVSTASFLGQNAKMSATGKVSSGKTERRKELGLIAMMHPDVFVAQVSPAYYNHFFRTVTDAVDFPGPSLIIAYSSCMPEHGVADDAGFDRAKAAVVSRAFPIFVCDPRKGKALKERLDLKGNPSVGEDWHKDPKTNESYDFIWFAKHEERFSQHFDKQGVARETLTRAQEDRAANWRMLRELAGLIK